MRKTALTLGGFLIATGAALTVSAPAQAAPAHLPSCECGPSFYDYAPTGQFAPQRDADTTNNTGVQHAQVEQHGLINIALVRQNQNIGGLQHIAGGSILR